MRRVIFILVIFLSVCNFLCSDAFPKKLDRKVSTITDYNYYATDYYMKNIDYVKLFEKYFYSIEDNALYNKANQLKRDLSKFHFDLYNIYHKWENTRDGIYIDKINELIDNFDKSYQKEIYFLCTEAYHNEYGIEESSLNYNETLILQDFIDYILFD